MKEGMQSNIDAYFKTPLFSKSAFKSRRNKPKGTVLDILVTSRVWTRRPGPKMLKFGPLRPLLATSGGKVAKMPKSTF